MNKTSWIIIAVVIVIIIGGGIYWFATQSTSSSSVTSQATTSVPNIASTIILGSNAQFPSYLEAANGMALYTFKSDMVGMSNCTGSCATVWPPYTVPSASGLSVGMGIAGTVGTITRPDGTLQVTYNGMPLYFFAQDMNMGDVTGDGQGGFSVAMATATTSQATPEGAAPAQSPTQPAPAAATAPATPPAYNY